MSEPATHRLPTGELVTWAKPRFTHIQIRRFGAVHDVTGVIVRWNFNGGTPERPNVTAILRCGPQSKTGTTFTSIPKGLSACRSCLRCERKRQRPPE